ncbi:MAG TPA: nitroreductase family protein [Patescibacteria group bacterium]|jgi:hypothetical protein|nr:nitroreductase family protein [Patescibacteria group bacterium]
MKKNYKAWETNPNDFPKQKGKIEQYEFLIKFAVLAPSAHNTQPWKFEIQNDGIVLVPEIKRALADSDPNLRQLYISLGCALENLQLAARYYGYQENIKYFSSEQLTRVKISLTPGTATGENKSLIAAILERRTNRAKYKPELPPPDFLSWIKNLESNDLKVDMITNQAKKDEVAKIVNNALVETMDDPLFRKELSRHLKSNVTKEKSGMPGFAFGLPTPISLVFPHLIKLFNPNRLSKKQDELLLKQHTPVLIVISTKSDEPTAWLSAGKVYEMIAIKATQQKLAAAPLAAAIQNEKFRQKLKKALNTELYPQVFFRLGYPFKGARPSPRFESADVIGNI